MLIKDPSRFQIRNAQFKDCVQLYQLIKKCYLELCENGVWKSNEKSNQIDYYYDENANIVDENGNMNHPNIQNNDCNDLNKKPSMNNGVTLLESFEEFVDCLGFGKRGEERKVLDCLLIEDVNEQKIIALVTYSYGYFSYVGKEIHMNHFYVRPEYRLNGFGRFLIKNLIKLAAQANLHKLKYDVPRTSKDFCRFMEKIGAKDFTEHVGYSLFRFDLRILNNKILKS